MAYSLTRSIAFYLPLVWFASRIDGSTTVYAAIAASNGLAGLVIAVESIRRVRRLGTDKEGQAAQSPGKSWSEGVQRHGGLFGANGGRWLQVTNSACSEYSVCESMDEGIRCRFSL